MYGVKIFIPGLAHYCVTLAIFPQTIRVAALRVSRDVGDEALHVQNLDQKTIPFYMYDDDLMSPFQFPSCKAAFAPKKFPDMALHLSLKSHPWRVLDPTQAKVFYVPAYLSAMVHDGWNKGCGEYFRELASILRNSSQFRRCNGCNHLISGHYFGVNRHVKFMNSLLPEMIVVTEDDRTRRGFVHRPVFAPYADALDFVNIQVPYEKDTTLFFMGQADRRDAYRLRRFAIEKLGSITNSKIVCVGSCTRDLPLCQATENASGCRANFSRTDYIDTLVRSKFGLMMSGDTPSSSRIYDYISAGAIPIIIGDRFREHAASFTHDIPWESFSFTISESAFRTKPVDSVTNILNSPDNAITSKLNALHQVRTALDWYSEQGTRVPSLILREAARKIGLNVPAIDYLELPIVNFAIENHFKSANSGFKVERNMDDNAQYWEHMDAELFIT
jgi:hypothetical protein